MINNLCKQAQAYSKSIASKLSLEALVDKVLSVTSGIREFSSIVSDLNTKLYL